MKKILLTLTLLLLAVGAVHATSPGVIVGTDDMMALANYTIVTNAAHARNASGSHGLTARAGTHFIAFTSSAVGARHLSIRLNHGFPSGHIIVPGTYIASIDTGVSNLNRDGFNNLDFSLVTAGGVEIGERTVIQPYVHGEMSEWTTIIVSYTIGEDSPAIGQRLSWSAAGNFVASARAKYGALDNVVVRLVEAGEWITAYQPIPAPFALNFGHGAGQEGAGRLLRSLPGNFSPQAGSLRYAPASTALINATALASVANYSERRNFTLESVVTLTRLTGGGDNRVGFSVLGGPHAPPDAPFNAIHDSGFYGLVWYPLDAAGRSRIAIQQGFNGPVLVEAPWGGRRPLGGGTALFSDNFENAAASNAAWTRGGIPENLWEIGQPTTGPGAAHGGVNVAATNLTGDYPPNTNSWLRTPVIDLRGVELATLSFYEFSNIDPNPALWHSTTVSARDPITGALIVKIARYADQTPAWRFRQFGLPQEALGRQVVIEFRLESDDIAGFSGWYIDDVTLAAEETITYTMRAAGVFDLGGFLDLSFTLADDRGHSQTISTLISAPLSGNLFGIGGRARLTENPAFDFRNFSMTMGEDPGPPIPSIFKPFQYAFGSDPGRNAGGDFLRNIPGDWSLASDALALTAGLADYYNSIATTRVFNFTATDPFFLDALVTLDNLSAGPSENRVAIVLFGEEQPANFKPAEDIGFYTLQWIPTSGGGLLAVREGMTGAIIAQTAFAGLANPPRVVNGATYNLRFGGTFVQPGQLAFTGVLTDGMGGLASVSGTMPVSASGRRFGFGARHRGIENPAWRFHGFNWFDLVPLKMPVDLRFGAAVGRDSDASFGKSGFGTGNWLLDATSLSISRPDVSTVASAANSTAGAGVIDYAPGSDFALRASVTPGDAIIPLEFVGGAHIATPVTSQGLGVDGNNPRTIEAWGYTRVFDNHATIWTMGNHGTAGQDFTLKVTGTVDRWVVNIWGAAFDLPFDIPGSMNRWIHFAVVHDGTEVRVYVDGEFAVSRQQQINTSIVQPFRIGWWQNRTAAQGLNGFVRDVRVWNTVRTRDEIRADMSRRLHGNEPGLVAYWPIDEGRGETAHDLVAGNHGIFRPAPAPAGNPPRWAAPQFGLAFLGGGAGLTDSYSLQWEPVNPPGGGALRINGPGEAGSLASVDLSGLSGAPTFIPGLTYTLTLAGFFNTDGSLSLTGSLRDTGGNQAELSARVLNPVIHRQTNWFGVTGRHTRLAWDTFQMGAPAQLGIAEPIEEGFVAWLNEHFSSAELADPSISGALAAPAGDGVANLLKYAFGLAPRVATGSASLPQATLVGDRLRLAYRERRNAQDIEYIPELSTSLAEWTGSGVVEVSRVQEGDFDLVTVEAALPANATRGFLRVMVRQR